MKSVRALTLSPLLRKSREKLMSSSLRDARAYYETTCQTKRKTRLVRVVDDTVEKTQIRVYNPTKVPQGVIVYAHGGGFIYGSIESTDQLCRMLAKFTKHTVISVDYSLAPKAKYPTQINEVVAVINALPELAERHNFLADDVTVAGDSAGGFIALHAAQKANVALSHLLLIYSMITPNDADMESMKDYENIFLKPRDIQKFWKDFLGDTALVSYTDTWLSKLPHTLIVTAEYDLFRDEARMLHNLIRNAGGASTLVNYRGMWHGFMQWPAPLSKRIKVFKRIARFMQMH